MNFTPLHDYVVISEIVQDQSDGGILLPNHKSAFHTGRVEAVGHGTYSETGAYRPLNVAVGDVVAFSPFTTIRVLGNEYSLAREADIAGVFHAD